MRDGPSDCPPAGNDVGRAAAEFLGTFVLIAFGDGVVAMAVAALNQSGRGELIFAASGDWLLIAWGWALAVAFGVYVAGGISGAHINPAVTLALAAKRAFPWRKVPSYWAAQLLGAFVGAALVGRGWLGQGFQQRPDLPVGVASASQGFSFPLETTSRRRFRSTMTPASPADDQEHQPSTPLRHQACTSWRSPFHRLGQR